MKVPLPEEIEAQRTVEDDDLTAEAERLRQEIGRARDEVREAWNAVRAAARSKIDVREKVRRDPLTFVGLALCFGLLMGLRDGGPRR